MLYHPSFTPVKLLGSDSSRPYHSSHSLQVGEKEWQVMKSVEESSSIRKINQTGKINKNKHDHSKHEKMQ